MSSGSQAGPEKNPGKTVVGLAWCGIYRTRSEHKLGWILPKFIAHHGSSSLDANQKRVLGRIPSHQFAHGDMWRVRVTIEAVKDKRGRFIVKRYRKPAKRVQALVQDGGAK